MIDKRENTHHEERSCGEVMKVDDSYEGHPGGGWEGGIEPGWGANMVIGTPGDQNKAVRLSCVVVALHVTALHVMALRVFGVEVDEDASSLKTPC
jgi:hypothetical protein